MEVFMKRDGKVDPRRYLSISSCLEVGWYS